jgi:hypothetical protein
MKSLRSRPDWSCSKSLAVLLPWMRWGRKNSIAAQIQQAQADYILGFKANHPTLWQQVDSWFQTARAENTLPMPSEHKTEAGHHHREIRSCCTLPLDSLPPLYQAESWVGLRTIVIVERTRHLWNQTTHAHSVLP